VVGISHVTYWINWIIVGTLLNLIQVTVLMLAGYVLRFELWHNADSNILFYLFFITG
jgi:hypothetical protein